jgi:hypothetical protein
MLRSDWVQSKAGKRYLIFDPTDEYTPLGDLRAELQDTYALLVTDAGGELIHTSLQPPENNTLVREGRFQLNPDGSLTGEVVEKRRGDHALWERHALKQANQQERLQLVEHLLNRSLQGFTLQSLEIQQLDDRDKELVLTYKFTVPNYAQVRGPLILARPRVWEKRVLPWIESHDSTPSKCIVHLAKPTSSKSTYLPAIRWMTFRPL